MTKIDIDYFMNATATWKEIMMENFDAMGDAIKAGDNVLMNEQAALLRECRAALDELLKKKPMMAGMLCGSTTLGNLRASLYEYRPKGVI